VRYGIDIRFSGREERFGAQPVSAANRQSATWSRDRRIGDDSVRFRAVAGFDKERAQRPNRSNGTRATASSIARAIPSGSPPKQ